LSVWVRMGVGMGQYPYAGMYYWAGTHIKTLGLVTGSREVNLKSVTF